MNETPRSNRLHIGLFGKRNSGKSSLVNALTGQAASLVSEVPGTTTDPVFKAMEIYGIGPCVFIDTAGFDDEGTLGELRIGQTLRALDRTDIALMVCTDEHIDDELQWSRRMKEKDVPVVWILNKCDLPENGEQTMRSIEKQCGQVPLLVSAKSRKGIEDVRLRIRQLLPDETMEQGLLGGLAEEGDTVMLVMPQDIQAPKGRLILPQVQTLRELLDRKCIPVCVVPENLPAALGMFPSGPALVITDSQAFAAVRKAMSDVFGKRAVAGTSARESVAGNTDVEVISDVIGGVPLTSFSILFSRYKGDIRIFKEGALAIDSLGSGSRVLIAEACSHRPLSEDIGRVKLPALLRKKAGDGIVVDVVAGADWPSDLGGYDLIIPWRYPVLQLSGNEHVRKSRNIIFINIFTVLFTVQF